MKTAHVYDLTVSVGQDFGLNVAECSVRLFQSAFEGWVVIFWFSWGRTCFQTDPGCGRIYFSLVVELMPLQSQQDSRMVLLVTQRFT